MLRSLQRVARTLRWGVLTCVLGAAFGAPVVHALDVPPLRARVTDLVGLLPPARAEALEARLAAHEQATQQQFALLIVPSLEGDSLEGFSIRVGEAWKLGRKGSDQGLILLIASQERKARVEVGYGLEGVIPDAVAARVIREVLSPAFREGDYAGGIDAAFQALIAAGGGDPGAPVPASGRARKHKSSPLFGPVLLPLVLFALISLLGRGGRRRGLGGIAPIIWGAGGGFGRGGGGGGWGGGGDGGGFSGGGGGFGGGGASGDW